MFVYSYSIVVGKSNLLKFEKAMIPLIIIGLLVYIISKIKNFHFKGFELFIFGLALFSLLSYFFAINKDCALWGAINRREGLFAYLFYYIIALIVSNINNKKFQKVIILEIIIIGFFNFIYGLLQTRIVTIPNVKIYGINYYAKGFLGNSMYYASLLSLCYPIFVGLFIQERNCKKSILYGIITCFFTFGLLISGAMAIVVSSICLFVYLIIKQLIITFKNKSKDNVYFFIKIIIIIIIFVLTNLYVKSINETYQRDLKNLVNETTSVVSGNIDNNFGARRIFIWKKSLYKIKEHPLTGIGIDNYRYGFNPIIRDPKNNRIIAKAHNDYLQRTVCEGVISGIYYLVFLAYIFVKNIKKNDKYHYALLLSFICYSIQIFFSISVTRVTPVYYIIMGLLMSDDAVFKIKKRNKVANK